MDTWKATAGFPGYEVSDAGQVRSIDRVVLRGGKEMRLSGCILSPRALPRGHLYVNLTDESGARRSVYVHRLVAIAFIGQPEAGRPQVAHWDGDAGNNSVGNLRWASNSENCLDGVRLGRAGLARGLRSGKAKLNENTLRAIVAAHGEGESLRSIGRRLGVSHQTVGGVVRGTSYVDELARIRRG